jgi:uncharacterized protein (DUF58 family)
MAGESKSTLAVPLFYRLLHGSYGRGTRMSFFLASRVTPAAWVLMSVIVLGMVLGMDMEKSTLYQIVVFGMALLVVGVLWAWARRAKLEATRSMPSYATAGEECRYSIQVENRGWGPVKGFWLWERQTDPRPELATFAFTKEPGEEERNFFDRSFVYYRWRWLMDRRILFRGGRSEGPLVVEKAGRVHSSVTFVPNRRGVIQMADLRVVLPDPFGLFQRCRKVATSADQIVVLPKRYRLPSLQLFGEPSLQMGGEAASNSVGQSGEVLGLRDYRAGDALRHIHWKGWAKAGKPIVKEFEDTYFPRYGLIFDNCVEGGDEEAFEEAVSVAASFASAIDTRQSLLDLMFVNQEAIVMTAGQGIAKAEKMLEVLAAVEADVEVHFEELRRLVYSHRDNFSACFCVFPEWSADRAEFLRRLSHGGLEVLGLIVTRDPEGVQRELREDPVPCRCVLLEPGRIQEGLMKV